MFDIFTHTIKIITDGTQRWTTRSAVVILILFGLWFLNDTFDFVNSFRANNKLQQLESIGQLLKDTTLTKNQTDLLVAERQNILTRKTTLDKVQLFMGSLPNPISLIKGRVTVTEKTTKVEYDSEKRSNNSDSKSDPIPVKNYWLNFVTSNAFILIVMFFVPLNVSYKQAKIWVIMVAMAFMYGVVFLICAFIAYLFDLIPVIAGMPWVNYILNFSGQLFVWMIIGYLLSVVSKKKTNQYATPT